MSAPGAGRRLERIERALADFLRDDVDASADPGFAIRVHVRRDRRAARLRRRDPGVERVREAEAGRHADFRGQVAVKLTVVLSPTPCAFCQDTTTELDPLTVNEIGPAADGAAWLLAPESV